MSAQFFHPFLIGVSLYGACRGFGRRGGSEVSRSHTIPQGMKAPITVVGGGTGHGGVRTKAKCEPGLFLCSVASTVVSGAWVGPEVLKQKP